MGSILLHSCLGKLHQSVGSICGVLKTHYIIFSKYGHPAIQRVYLAGWSKAKLFVACIRIRVHKNSECSIEQRIRVSTCNFNDYIIAKMLHN
jgi:hypothetical protein